MFCRLTILMMIAAALVGGGAPAFACVDGACAGDCCPSLRSPLQYERGGHASHTAAEYVRCCVAAPAPGSQVSVATARVHPKAKHSAGSSDPIVLIGGMLVSSARQFAPTITAADHLYRDDASRTYLRTARLRL